MCTDGNGLTPTVNEAAATVSLRSPVDLGWEQYGGGQWKDTAGRALWGSDWRETRSDQLQALLIVGVPEYLVRMSSTAATEQELSIPREFMVEAAGEDPYYANASAAHPAPHLYAVATACSAADWVALCLPPLMSR